MYKCASRIKCFTVTLSSLLIEVGESESCEDFLSVPDQAQGLQSRLMTQATRPRRLMAPPDHPHDTRQRPVTESRPERGRDAGRQRARATQPRSSWRARHATCLTCSCASRFVRHDRARARCLSRRTARARPASRRRAGCAHGRCQRRIKEFGRVLVLPSRSHATPRWIGGESQLLERAGLGHSRAAR